MAQADELLSIEEAAEMLGVKVRTRGQDYVCVCGVVGVDHQLQVGCAVLRGVAGDVDVSGVEGDSAHTPSPLRLASRLRTR
jgi:hypothetical protein